jgi:hypothetical protein
MRVPFITILLLSTLVLSGCVGPLDPDPLNRPGNWVMNAAPLENTAVQVSDKSDLLQGKSDSASDGVAAAAGVDLAIGGAAGTATGLQKAPVAITFSSGTGS